MTDTAPQTSTPAPLKTLKIDFVSDVVCPWCVVGLRGLEIALAEVAHLVEPELTLHAFELNPDMAPEGEPLVEHVARKYGATPEASAASRARIAEQAAAVGFTMNMGEDSRIRNTFDAHRLLAWAHEQGRQLELNHALLAAHFTDNRDIADPAVLAKIAAGIGLDGADEVLASDRYAREVREEEAQWRAEGITAVPTLIVEDKWVIAGAHPPGAYAQALRRLAREVQSVRA